jgi:Acetoacetate decarboxylase (ADC)
MQRPDPSTPSDPPAPVGSPTPTEASTAAGAAERLQPVQAGGARPYPPSPWSLNGQMRLSLWRVGRGLVGTAFVEYQPGSVLTYSELLRARPTRLGRGVAVTITDIWVNSSESCQGGRELWAIPKDMATFSVQREPTFLAGARRDGGAIAIAEFAPGRGLPRRLPFRARTAQRRDDGRPVVTPLTGSARVRRAHAAWEFASDGPFADLRGRRPLLSVVLEDFELTFGDQPGAVTPSA